MENVLQMRLREHLAARAEHEARRQLRGAVLETLVSVRNPRPVGTVTLRAA